MYGEEEILLDYTRSEKYEAEKETVVQMLLNKAKVYKTLYKCYNRLNDVGIKRYFAPN